MPFCFPPTALRVCSVRSATTSGAGFATGSTRWGTSRMGRASRFVPRRGSELRRARQSPSIQHPCDPLTADGHVSRPPRLRSASPTRVCCTVLGGFLRGDRDDPRGLPAAVCGAQPLVTRTLCLLCGHRLQHMCTVDCIRVLGACSGGSVVRTCACSYGSLLYHALGNRPARILVICRTREVRDRYRGRCFAQTAAVGCRGGVTAVS